MNVYSRLVCNNSIVIFSVMMVLTGSAFAADEHKIEFMDSMWDGKTIPSGMECTAQVGKNPHTPKLKITKLPAGTKYLRMVITDENAGSDGQHGIFRLKVPSGATEVIFPSIYETAKKLPSGVTLEKNEGWGMSKEGHYLPPCSNGRDHNYYADIIPYDENDEKLGENYIEFGKY